MATRSDASGRSTAHAQLLGELLPLAVHALAQPINIVQGYSDLLPRIDDRPEQRARALNAIAEAAERLADILVELRGASASEQVATELIRRYGAGVAVVANAGAAAGTASATARGGDPEGT